MVTGRHWVMVMVVAGAACQLEAAERSTVTVRRVTTFSPSAELVGTGRAVPLDGESRPADGVVCTEADADNHRVARGAYLDGERHGKWTRWFRQGEGLMFTAPEYKEFPGPFSIEVELDHGIAHGTCTVYDSQKRRVSAWELQNSKPHGALTWWYADGHPRRVAHFQNGRLEGELREWDTKQQLEVNQQYACGKRLEVVEETDEEGKVSCRGVKLLPGDVTEWTFNWFAGMVDSQIVQTATEETKHGHWDWWYPNGRKELEGDYDDGRAVGRFTWRYPNGQKRMEADYTNGKLDGQVVAWHINGQKELQGLYADDVQIGPWRRWDDQGQLIDQQEHLLANPASESEFTSARPASPKLASQFSVSPPRAAAKSVAIAAPQASAAAAELVPTASTETAGEASLKIIVGDAGPAPRDGNAVRSILAPSAQPQEPAPRTTRTSAIDSRLR